MDIEANKLGVCIFVGNIDLPGGMERQAWRLAKELSDKGTHVTLISSRFIKKITLKDICWQKDIKNNVDIYRIPMLNQCILISPMSLFYISSLYLMFKLRNSFDVIYGVQLYSYGAVACFAGKILNKPVVVKIAGGGYSGDITMFNKIPLGRLKKRIARWGDAYVNLSRQIERELEMSGFERNKIMHIPNGVDTTTFHPANNLNDKSDLKAKLGLPNRKIVIFVGRLDSGKRVDFLIDVFKSSLKQCHCTHLVIIGDGPDREKIKSMADDNITIVGTVENVNEYLRASDVLVIPTLAEGMSNVILEAMATGLPVITTNVSSNPEIIENGIDGILLDINDKEGFVKNILQLLSDTNLASDMGRRARQKIEHRFSLKKVTDNYLTLFSKLIDNRQLKK